MDLLVAGGEALLPQGWSVSDVLIRKGRIVPGQANVGYGGETVDGAGGTTEECRTGGAGAERATLAATVEGDTVLAARGEPLAAGGEVGSTGSAGVPVLDARGLRVVPGFVDLQCNGGFGIDLATEPERLWQLAAALPRTGVTAWLPTIISAPPAVRGRALAALRAGPPPPGLAAGAVPLGLHFEGPLLNPERRGAHPADLLRRPGDADVGVSGWSRQAGVALVTLAPELPGALDVVRRLVDQGVVVSAGHSSATAAQATAAIDGGVRWVTHLFNAMAPLHHREPGLAGVALADDRVRAGVIADGVHVHSVALAVAARALGDRLTLVTDAVAALGRPPGPVRLGSVEAVVDGDAVRLADGTLAGSTLSLDRAVRTLAGLGAAGLERPVADGAPVVGAADRASLAAAVRAASTTPAAVLGLGDRGVIAPGAIGDLVLLDDAGTVVATVISGEVAYDRRT